MLEPLDMGNANILLFEKKHSEKYRYQQHHHEICQLVYVIEGRGIVSFDQQEHPLSPDNVVLITPFTDHSFQSDSRLTLLIIAFSDHSFIGKELGHRLLDRSRILSLSRYMAYQVMRLLRKMLYEQSQKTDFYEYALTCHLTDLLLNIYRTMGIRIRADLNYSRAESIRNYIDTHYYEISLLTHDLQNILKISIRYADNIFKEYYQITPRQYLTEVRMEHSKRMLAESDKNIAAICFEVGYENLSTFYRTFKIATGLSPIRYRQELRHR